MGLCQSRGQVSLEYLVILGVALFLLIPIMGMFYSSTIESQNLNKANLMILSGRAITTNAENVYYQGKGSKIMLELNFPEGLELTVKNESSVSELIMSAEFDNLNSDFVFFANTNLMFANQSDPCNTQSDTGDVLGLLGPKTLFVQSCGTYVVIYSYDK